MPDLIVLSHYEVKPLLEARRDGRTTASISPDLGLTSVEVALSAEGVTFPSGEELELGKRERNREVGDQVLPPA